MAEPMPHLLVVDDDVLLREFIVDYLTRQGFIVDAAGDAVGLWVALEKKSYDLVLLDLGLPGEDGLSIARRLRDRARPGVLIVSGRAETHDRVEALHLGADDYVTKPVEPRELLARVRSVLRRLPPAETGDEGVASAPALVTIGRHRLDLASRRLLDADGGEVPLTAMEYDLLVAFLRHPNQDLSRDQLMLLAHGREWNPLERGLDIRVTRLRQKLEDDPAAPTLIQTVRGIGYRLNVP